MPTIAKPSISLPAGTRIPPFTEPFNGKPSVGKGRKVCKEKVGNKYCNTVAKSAFLNCSECGFYFRGKNLRQAPAASVSFLASPSFQPINSSSQDNASTYNEGGASSADGGSVLGKRAAAVAASDQIRQQVKEAGIDSGPTNKKPRPDVVEARLSPVEPLPSVNEVALELFSLRGNNH